MPNMDAIIGKYRIRMEETGLILKHVSGISFNLTPEEALGLLDFLNAYRQTLQAVVGEVDTVANVDTDPQMKRIVLTQDED
jgi:hypothetical protein